MIRYYHFFLDSKTGKDEGLQIGADFRDYKSGQEGLQLGAALGITKLAKGLQIGQGLQIGANGLQIGAGITNRGKRDYKSWQGLQIGAVQLIEEKTRMLLPKN